jgi:Domain of unknown function (DUF3425)
MTMTTATAAATVDDDWARAFSREQIVFPDVGPLDVTPMSGEMPVVLGAGLLPGHAKAEASLPYGVIPNATPFLTHLYPHPSLSSFLLTSSPTPTLFLDVLINTLRTTSQRIRFSLVTQQWVNLGLPKPVVEEEEAERADSETAAELCRIALRVVRGLGIGGGAFGWVPSFVTERVYRWRICPTRYHRHAIPPPYLPTPIQHLAINSPDPYPHAIDFLPWPTLRDQLIIYSGCYDTQLLVRDTVMNLVREVPSLKIALPVFGVWRGLVDTVGLSGRYASEGGSGVVEEEEEEEEDEEKSDDEDKVKDDTKVLHRKQQPCMNTISQLSRMYGLHRLHERKLGPRFAAKYPFLDVKSSKPIFPSPYCPSRTGKMS